VSRVPCFCKIAEFLRILHAQIKITIGESIGDKSHKF
jgi:hypothetical protein